MLPTVGRIVYYKAYGTPGGEYKPGAERAAIVTSVNPDDPRIVSLCVLNPTGMFFNLDVIQGDGPGQWNWMPYQVGHQKRLEELTKKQELLDSILDVKVGGTTDA